MSARRSKSPRRKTMPLTRIALRRGKPPQHLQAIMDGVYAAMRETFDVPEDDRFMMITQHEAGEFLYGRHYLGIERSDDLVLIQLTVSNTRTVEQKKALFAAIAKKLGDNPGLRPQDVFVNLVEVGKENWSFGHGLAQYA